MPFNDRVLTNLNIHPNTSLVDAVRLLYETFELLNKDGIDRYIDETKPIETVGIQGLLLTDLVQLKTFAESPCVDLEERRILQRLILNIQNVYTGNEGALKGRIQDLLNNILEDMNKLLDKPSTHKDRNTLHKILYGSFKILTKEMPSNAWTMQYHAINLVARTLGINYAAYHAKILELLSKLETTLAVYDSSDSNNSASAIRLAAAPAAPTNPIDTPTQAYWTLQGLQATALAVSAAAAEYMPSSLFSTSSSTQAEPTSWLETLSALYTRSIGQAPSPKPSSPLPSGPDLESMLQDRRRPLVLEIGGSQQTDPQVQAAMANLKSNVAAYYSSAIDASPRDPSAALLTREDLVNAVTEAQDRYQTWFNGGAARSISTYFLERRFFHTPKGQQHALALLTGLQVAGTVEDMKAIIYDFLNERKGYKQNSFVSYLLDELMKIEKTDAPWREITLDGRLMFNKAEVLNVSARDTGRGPA